MSSETMKEAETSTVGRTVTHGEGEMVMLADVDVAAAFLQSLDISIKDNPVTAAEARKVLWKIDLYVLPLIAGTVILSAVDKVIISNAAVLGMKKDLHLVGNEYSWVGSIFYFGFLLFEWPTTILIQKLPVAKLLAGLVCCWAILLCSIAATQNFGGIAVARFIMGCTEAGAFPIASILTVMWYSNREQPIRVAFWYNQVCLVLWYTFDISSPDTFCAVLLSLFWHRIVRDRSHKHQLGELASPIHRIGSFQFPLGTDFVGLPSRFTNYGLVSVQKRTLCLRQTHL